MIADVYFYCFESEGNELADPEKRDGQRAGAYLAYEKINVEKIYYPDQPVYRALAHKLVKAMGAGTKLTQSLDFGMVGCLQTLVDQAGEALLFIGSCADLAGLCKGGLGEDGAGRLTEGLVGLKKERKEGVRRWRVAARVERDKLPRKFAFPAPRGPERRNRPAYYYTQSAVKTLFHRLRRSSIMALLLPTIRLIK